MKTITNCRVCQSDSLDEILNLGNQPLSGVFPASKSEVISSGPLRLVRCKDCALVQLGESYDHSEMYGDNYGYRSSLNPSMVAHLSNIAHGLKRKCELKSGSVICDIGSNDSTFLNFFLDSGATLVGIDPTIHKHSHFYDPRIVQIPELFSATAYLGEGLPLATLVTSIAMFYDLEDPVKFATEIYEVLEPDGLWFFEQSYAPWMQTSGAYDTICHEHLEFYSLESIKNILQKSGFQIIEVTTNATNGGSISILASKVNGSARPISEYAKWLLENERKTGANSLENWQEFSLKVESRKESLNALITEIHKAGKTVYGLGASTKGNVLLNYSGITQMELPLIGEVNPDKWGKFTPGSLIPIVDEAEILALNPDYLLFLPWHFRDFAISKYSNYLQSGGRFIFPLPDVEVIGY